MHTCSGLRGSYRRWKIHYYPLTESIFQTFPYRQILEKLWPLIRLNSLSALPKMSSQAPLCEFNVVWCVSNSTLLSEHDIGPFSKSLEPTGKWHTYYPQSSLCFNKMSTWKIDLHFSNPSPPTYRALSWNERWLIDHGYTENIPE